LPLIGVGESASYLLLLSLEVGTYL
jgi:hypothetical protein